ncbi:MAG TPA: hypothetical protein VED63_06470, partial [Acidimicrobiales bacterium]|nr:hypothetical protein [Acidimicrobiales bacterium]
GRLVNGFLTEVHRRGAGAAVVVVGAENRRAQAVYARAGFVAAEAFEFHPGQRSLRLRWEATAAPDRGASELGPSS